MTPAWARQDHTTSPSAARFHQDNPAVNPATARHPTKPLQTSPRLATQPRPIAFRLTFRDVGDTPLRPKRNGGECTSDFVSGKRKYFWSGGLTGFGGWCPSGNSVDRKVLLRAHDRTIDAAMARLESDSVLGIGLQKGNCNKSEKMVQ
jgi:hypothetical protein